MREVLESDTGEEFPADRCLAVAAFHCHDMADPPRTHSRLEQRFGTYRHHERAADGIARSG